MFKAKFLNKETNLAIFSLKNIHSDCS